MNKAILFVLVFLNSVRAYSQYEIYTPADYLNKKFQQYNVICLDEGPHSTLQAHEFLRSLLSNDTLNSQLDYLIVEFANIKYQDILDSYISGEDVTMDELRQVWRNSSQTHSPIYERPVYLKLLCTIREVNKSIIGSHKIRVLAGDPEIDWSKINTINDYFKNISQRDVFPSELAIKYGINEKKNVLLIYGGEHVSKASDSTKDSTYWTIPYYINRRYPNSVFTIGILNSESFNYRNTEIPIGSIAEFPASNASYDAFYFVGNSDNFVTDKPGKIDKAYWEEMNRRSKIVWDEGLDESLIENHNK